MTKQEWIKRIEILMLTGRDCFGVCEEYDCTDCQDKAKEVYEGIEQDLLKEFVEWLKDRFDKRIDEQTAKCERIESEYDDGTSLTSYLEYVANNEGILTGFVNAKWWLEELDTIEKFLEERKNAQ